MEFPAEWTVMSTDEARAFNAGLVDFPLQLAVLLELDGGEVQNFHIHLGGTQIIKAHFAADSILGKGFEGNNIGVTLFLSLLSLICSATGSEGENK